ncbi:MAG TPA: HEAT repeat domain-containing protein [Phycisphaerae bacterium]|nr:HEAT repeat domain-containing protein [Phycisphaerae bacterium]
MGCCRRLIAACVAACIVSVAALPAGAGEPSLGQDLKELPKYTFGQSREHLTRIADAVRDAKGAERARLRTQLAAVLGSNATPDAKRFVCRQLSIVGTAQEVPALAALLLDKELSDIARYALERTPDEAALKAMRDALPKAEPGVRIGIINSLGIREDKAVVGALIPLLKGSDVPIAIAAAGALGKIGGAEAVKALADARGSADDKLKSVAADAYLLCADRLLAEKKTAEAASIYQDMFKPTEAKHVQMAALRGIVASGGEKTLPLLTELLTGNDTEMQAAALRFVREVSGPETTKALTGLLPKLPAATQAMLLDDLATRGDASALPAVMTAAKSNDEAVKEAAVKAMGKVGDASTLPLLTSLASGGGPLADQARASLDILPGANVNDAMIGLAEQGNTDVRKEVIRSLGVRRVGKAVPVLLKTAGDADSGIRVESVKALEIVADEKCAPAMVSLVVKAKDDGDLAAAEKALGTLAGRAENKDAVVTPILSAVGGAPTKAKCALIRALGRAGGSKALGAVSNAVRDADESVQDAAVRSLADWADAGAAAQLLTIAKTSQKTTHQVLALRGYIRIAGLDGVSAADKLKMYAQAMAAAKRPDEKKQVLGGLGNVKAVEALKMVIPALDDKALEREAAVAAVNIAKNLGARGKDDIRTAMQKVLEITKDKRLRKDADDLLKKAGGPKK